MNPRLRTSSPERKIGAAFVAWFVFCAVAGLTTLGVTIWAVISLVNHFTG